MIGLPEWATIAAPAALETLKAHMIEPDGYALPAYAAVEIAAAALADADKPAASRSPRCSPPARSRPRSAASAFDAKGDLANQPVPAAALRRRPIRGGGCAVTYRTGPRNLITDVAGLRVGNADDPALKSGVTAVICDAPAVAGVRSWAARRARARPICWSRTTRSGISTRWCCRAVRPSASMRRAACRRRCAKRASALRSRALRIPIVPAAILFDLRNGGDKDWGRYPPYRELGYEACRRAAADFALGTVGAGTGALAAGFKGGLGSASTVLPNGVTVGALVVVNATGAVTVGQGCHFWAAPLELGDEFGGLGLPSPLPADAQESA